MKQNQPKELASVITEPRLRTAAGDRAFARGVGYFESGAVEDMVVTGTRLKARVMGTYEYAVTLAVKNGKLDYDCTCPVGEDGEFCKHAVAAGLAWLAQRADPAQTPLPTGKRKGKTQHEALRDHLNDQPKETLVDLLMEQTVDDAALRSRLQSAAARHTARSDPALLQNTVRQALAVHGFVDYYGMRRFLARAEPVEDLIAGVLADKHADTAMELAGYALQRGLAAYYKTDDSDGMFGDLLQRIAELHLKACRAAQPDGPRLAKNYFALRLVDDWNLLPLSRYARLLGAAGLKTYRALVEKEWAKVPARKSERQKETSDARHHAITHLMEELAEHTRDIDALIAIKQRDLTTPWRYLDIANILVKARRGDEALAWAERGRRAFPDQLGAGLADFLAAHYVRRRRHADAVAVIWDCFRQQPALASYKRLKTCADRAKAWDTWRAKALAWLREEELKARQRNRHTWLPRTHALLVEIFLWEGDSDAALAEANRDGCTESLWFAIARAREPQHPADAIAIYRQHLDDIVNRKTNDAYDQAADLVNKVRTLIQRLGKEKDFAAWLEGVRTRHKAKRNFMQRLDKITQSSSKSR